MAIMTPPLAVMTSKNPDHIGVLKTILTVCSASSTASITSTILQYRTIQGRTFHSEKFNTEYFAPNDDQQSESMDIT